LTTVTGSEFAILLADARRGGRPWLRRGVAVACLTSAVGYLALAASGLAVLREFGLLLTASVVLSYLAALTVSWLLPAAGPRARTRVERPIPRPSPTEVTV
jgi:predicted exporter